MITINKNRLIDRLNTIAEYGRDETGGWSRYTFSDADIKVKEVMKGWAESIGMKVHTDPVGNFIATLAGKDSSLPPLSMGSHVDSVKNGGMYDGVYGVVSAFEAVTRIVEEGIMPERNIEVIAFAEEEGSAFGASLFGSKAMAGKADSFYLEKANDDGLTLGEAMKRVGCDPANYATAKREKGAMSNYLELHIEQGKVLDKEDISIGAVTGIVGFCWAKMILKGCADHAGATPMNIRVDAMVPAAMIIAKAEEISNRIGNMVATIGKISILPNAINIVPGEVTFYMDIRSLERTNISLFLDEIKNYASGICIERNVEYEFELLAEADPTILADECVDTVEKTAKELGYSVKRMPSGAGHDAQLMSLLTNTGMIFVPSKDGISHNPKEYTDPELLEKGANVLVNTTLALL